MAFQEVIDAKQRIIQEFVPGKQVTIAHVIANPKPDLFRKMGLEEKGRNATVKNVLHHLLPGVKIGCGRYKHVTPNFELSFNGFLGQMIVEIVDNTGFKRSVTNARELRAIIS